MTTWIWVTVESLLALSQYCLGAWRHQGIIWTNPDLSLKVFDGIHLGAIVQEVLMNLIRNMCLVITH